MSRKRKPGSGLFPAKYDDGTRIRREEYGELYRLHRICSELEKGQASSSRRSGRPPSAGYSRVDPSMVEANPFYDD